jgi:hypothetical protein
MERDPLVIINEFLGLELAYTVRGDELKGWKRDLEDGGSTKFYLNRAECEVLSRAFARAAEGFSHGRKLY